LGTMTFFGFLASLLPCLELLMGCVPVVGKGRCCTTSGAASVRCPTTPVWRTHGPR
jgi:hypothetical protein